VLSAPSKIFLLGEYAVLAGRPALVAAFGPRFQLSSSPFEGSGELVLHPQSPAARILAPAGSGAGLPLHWSDPWRGAGGFGASSAQALMASELVSPKQAEPLQAAWRRYRLEGSPTGGVAPSGADFVAQAMGGVIEFRILPGDPDRFEARQIGDVCSKLHLRGVQASQQAGRKVATHDHLASLSGLERLASVLESVLERGIRSFESGDAGGLARALNDYGERLASLDLEDGATRRDRDALGRVAGVMGIKGSGAMQADALVALIDPARFDSEAWQRELSSLDLRDLGPITGMEPGLLGGS